MGKEIKIGCGSKSSANVKENEGKQEVIQEESKGEMKMVQIGKPAPLFEAEAYEGGKFTSVNLEDYRGKWVLLCFYPGDFTFV